MMDTLHAPNLVVCPSIRHAFFGRRGGVSEGIYDSLNGKIKGYDRPEHVTENRRRVAHVMDVPEENLLSCDQVHSPEVVTVTALWDAPNNPPADAMVTRERGIALGILTADCVPVLFADEEAGVIGAAHAGWRGAIGGAIENTLAAMEKLGAGRGRIIAALGPCIAQNSYEVGPSFPAPFLAEDPASERFFRAGHKGHYFFDLPAYVMAKLKKQGVADVAPPPADTCADEARFFSYRRNTLRGEKRVGSGLSVIRLTKETGP